MIKPFPTLALRHTDFDNLSFLRQAQDRSETQSRACPELVLSRVEGRSRRKESRFRQTSVFLCKQRDSSPPLRSGSEWQTYHFYCGGIL